VTAARRLVVRTDPQRCAGAGNCTRLAGTVFDQSEEGTVVLLARYPGAEQVDAVLDAVDACPTGAIEVEPPPDEA